MAWRRILGSPLVPALILLIAAVPVVVAWTGDDVPDVQKRFLRTVFIAAGAALLLLAWTAFLAPFSGRRRGTLAGGAAVLLIGIAALFRVEGTSGDLVPILRPRWASTAVADAPARTADPGLATDSPRFLADVPRIALDPDWAARPPAVLWTREVGAGWSGFSVAGGRAVTQEQQGAEECVVALDLATGRELWRHADSARYDTSLGGVGPRATPTIDGGRVTTLGATGRLNCLDLATGKLLWTADIAKDAGAAPPEWGYAGSPLVEGGRVVVQPGGLASYDALTGARRWTSPPQAPSYASPMSAMIGGRRQIVAIFRSACAGHDPSTGEVLWSREWPGETPKAAQPAVLDGDRVIVSAGYTVGTEAFRVTATGPEPLWSSKRLKAKFASFVVSDGFLYGLDDGRLVCLRVDTGERAWAGERTGHGQILRVGEFLLVTTERGEVVLVDVDPAAFRERGRVAVFDRKLWNPPALAGPYLLLRTDRRAACLELPRRSGR